MWLKLEINVAAIIEAEANEIDLPGHCVSIHWLTDWHLPGIIHRPVMLWAAWHRQRDPDMCDMTQPMCVAQPA